MVNEVMDFITAADPQVGQAIRAEYDRQQQNIELIASENIVSAAVLAAAGTVLTNKYAEGYPGKRYYGGCQCVDVVENIAIERAKELFGANYANVQPHSGAQANFAVYQALCQHGDTVLGMSLDQGGHLTHGSPVNFSGKNYNMVAYGLGADGRIDYDQVRDLARKHKPRMILAGASAYPRTIDFRTFADIAHEVGAYLFVDMAHIAGLVAAGWPPSPTPMLCPPPPTRPSGAPGAGCCCATTRILPKSSTPPSSPAPRAAPWSTSSPPRRWPWARPSSPSSRPISSRS